jgi:hypothetical protein
MSASRAARGSGLGLIEELLDSLAQRLGDAGIPPEFNGGAVVTELALTHSGLGEKCVAQGRDLGVAPSSARNPTLSVCRRVPELSWCS